MSGSGTERKLAAIHAADVVGFSRQMSADEAGIWAQWQSHRRGMPTAHRPRKSGHSFMPTGLSDARWLDRA